MSEIFENVNYNAISYNFTIGALYEDSTTYDYQSVIQRVKDLYFKHVISQYVYIVHDQDVVVQSDIDRGRYLPEELGKPRKKHTHLLVSFYTQRSVKSFLTLLNLFGNTEDGRPILNNRIKSETVVSNFKGYVRYLIHRTEDSKDKHQYHPTELICSNDKIIEKLLTDSVVLDDISVMKDIIDFIDSGGATLSIRDVYDFCAGIGDVYIACFYKPKFYRTIKDFVDIHRSNYYGR